MADDIRKELDTLKEDVAKLREDIAGLTDAVKSTASENVTSAKADAQARMQQAWEDIETRFDDILNEGKTTYSRAEQKVTDHPAGSVMTAFGLGFLIAKLLHGERH
jgi:ElaB/YqjD/DUF883 family membrane-anchored ribosome-binding protein